jgi:hypothetical protein
LDPLPLSVKSPLSGSPPLQISQAFPSFVCDTEQHWAIAFMAGSHNFAAAGGAARPAPKQKELASEHQREFALI